MPGPEIGHERLPFKLVVGGYSGNLVVKPLPPVGRDSIHPLLPDYVPTNPYPEETPADLERQLAEEFLTPQLDFEGADTLEACGQTLDIDWFGNMTVLEATNPRTFVEPVWPGGGRPGEGVGTPSWLQEQLEWDLPEGLKSQKPTDTGAIIDLAFQEVAAESSSGDPLSSSSLLRRPGLPEDFVRGSTRNLPFRPGGLEVVTATDGTGAAVPAGALDGTWMQEVLAGGPLQVVPPGFKRGLVLPGHERVEPLVKTGAITPPPVAPPAAPPSQAKALQYEDLFKSSWEEETEESENESEDESAEPETEPVAAEAPTPEAEGLSEPEKRASGEAEKALEELLAATRGGAEWWQGEKGRKGARPKKQQESKGQTWAVMERIKGIDEKFHEWVPDMAHHYPFELDSFQKEAVYHLERNESVFVAAHTSAGKTVVAEYAFALATKHCTRAIYTSPIKTISNQKFRDFSSEFDVGLLTGDVSIRPEAACLIMTTEILRSMLYKGADIIRDIEWVIFDEVHYVNDVERGVVWEEVIIMLPDHVNIVLLSATVPNTFEFADWIGRTKKKKIYVTGTTRRPVPLEHCLYYSGDLYKICEKETFLPQGHRQALAAFKAKTQPKPAAGGGGRGGGQGGPARRGGPAGRGSAAGGGAQKGGWRTETAQWYALVEVLKKKSLLPVVVFCFSKKRVDSNADSLSGLDLTTASEKSEIHHFCDKAFSRLKGSDRRLPQVLRVQELLKRGIGVHHAGLLPIVKETVEMLFCRGIIQILFSTETFAMGVNAPARTVAFHSLRKHDGKNFRQLLPGEYTQMAGRAGRRGLDKVGTVLIMCWDEVPEEGAVRTLLTGRATRLESQFRLTYNMILNLLRVEDLKVEDMLKRSFAEFHAQRLLPEQQQQLLRGEMALRDMDVTIDCIFGDPTIEQYYSCAHEAEQWTETLTETLMQSRAAQQAMVPGRLLLIHTQDHPPTPAVLLRVIASAASGNAPPPEHIVLALHRGPLPKDLPLATPPAAPPRPVDEPGFVVRSKRKDDDDVDYSLKGSKLRSGSEGGGVRESTGVVQLPLPYYGEAGGSTFFVQQIKGGEVLSMWRDKVRVDAAGVLETRGGAPEPTAAAGGVRAILDIEAQYPGASPPTLDLLRDLKIADVEVCHADEARTRALGGMFGNQCHRCPKLREHYQLWKTHAQLKEQIKTLKFQLSDANLQQMPDFKQRVVVLQRLGYLDADRVVQLKGRVACEINSGDELVAGEMIFDNQLDDLTPPEAVALLSALVFQEKDASEPELTATLGHARDRLWRTALQAGQVQAECGLPVDPEEYARGAVRFGLVEAVYEWAKGTPFADICMLTNVPEGSIVRTIVRLDETCREFRNAARVIGDSGLYQKMEQASAAIKRDIVFAASLYVTGTAVT